jgi:hypothetical protein
MILPHQVRLQSLSQPCPGHVEEGHSTLTPAAALQSSVQPTKPLAQCWVEHSSHHGWGGKGPATIRGALEFPARVPHPGGYRVPELTEGDLNCPTDMKGIIQRIGYEPTRLAG